jgi:hypothetical protein
MTYFETIRVGEMDDLNNKQVIGMTCMPLGGGRILQRPARARALNCRIHLCWYGIRHRCDIDFRNLARKRRYTPFGSPQVRCISK